MGNKRDRELCCQHCSIQLVTIHKRSLIRPSRIALSSGTYAFYWGASILLPVAVGDGWICTIPANLQGLHYEKNGIAKGLPQKQHLTTTRHWELIDSEEAEAVRVS